MKALELNLFESETSWNDHRRRRNEIISTRIYLLLLMFAAIILIIYTTATIQTQSITTKHPTEVSFEQLVSNPRYSPTLDCPCQNISIPYNSFMSISPHYHQLCSSDFVVQHSLWINFVYNESNSMDYPYDDYRLFVVSHFRLLFYLCTLANDTLTDALSVFRLNTLISKQAQSRQAVKTQIEAAIDHFRSSTSQTFMRMLDFIREMAQGNGLVSSISSNWHAILLSEDNAEMRLAPRSYGANNCSCVINSMCTSSTHIDEWIVPGFLVGCYALESLRQSTLECLYNFTCIDRLKNMYRPSNITIRPLDSTLSSPYVTIQSLMDVLMVDRWESDVIYEHYYERCAPLSCTYVITDRANLIYVITAIIGLCGGLSVVLEIIVPVLVKVVRYLMMCRRQRIEPAVTVVSDQQ